MALSVLRSWSSSMFGDKQRGYKYQDRSLTTPTERGRKEFILHGKSGQGKPTKARPTSFIESGWIGSLWHKSHRVKIFLPIISYIQNALLIQVKDRKDQWRQISYPMGLTSDRIGLRWARQDPNPFLPSSIRVNRLSIFLILENPARNFPSG